MLSANNGVRFALIAAAVLAACTITSTARAATLTASYTFDGNLSATQVGAPALTAIDPAATNSFGTDTVFSSSHGIYNFTGLNSPPTSQGGLSVGTTGLITSNSYSVEMVFKFNERNNAYRRVFDVQNRQSDQGFYVDPGNHLNVFPVGGSTTGFVTGQYYDITLTNDGTTVKAYISGNPELSLLTSEMNVDSNNIINFFVDNVVAGGQGEWSSGSVALIKLYDGVLTQEEVQANDLDPFKDVPTPEPTSLGALGVGAIGLLLRRRR